MFKAYYHSYASILKSISLFFLFFTFHLSNFGQSPFKLFESTWETDPMGPLIDTFHINVSPADNDFSIDTQILLDGVNATNATNISELDQTCIDYSSYPHYFYTYTLDTICTNGIEWEQLEISACNTGVCNLYTNIELPHQGEEIHYGFPEYRCNRNSFALTFQNIDTSIPSFLELVLRIGTINYQSGTLNFNNQYYSEFPIIVSINGGTCSNAQFSAMGAIGSTTQNEFEVRYPKDGSNLEINIHQNVDLKYLQLDLTTITGQTIRSIDINDYRTTISPLNLNTGIYFLVMTDLYNGHKTSKRIFIQ